MVLHWMTIVLTPSIIIIYYDIYIEEMLEDARSRHQEIHMCMKKIEDADIDRYIKSILCDIKS